MEIKHYFIQNAEAVIKEGTPDTIMLHDTTRPNPTPAPEPCCEELWALHMMSNTLLEMAEDSEEWMKDVKHPDHTKLRKQIRDHACLHPITAQLLKTIKAHRPEMVQQFEEAFL